MRDESALGGYGSEVLASGSVIMALIGIAIGLIAAFSASNRRRRSPRSRRILTLHLLVAAMLFLGSWWFLDTLAVRVLHFIAAGMSLGFALLILSTILRWTKLMIPHLLHHLTVSFVATWMLGLMLYDDFRVVVRLGILDEHYPWLTAMFEIKEHTVLFIMLGLVATSAWFLLSRPRFRRGGLVSLWSVSSAVVILFAAITGILISDIREV